VRLEEAVRDSRKGDGVQSGTPGHIVAEAVSAESRCDYIVYTMRDYRGDVVAVLIETKMTHHSKFQHVIAQVLGYFVAYTSEFGNPPLVFVLSEKTCKLLLFPFVNDKEEDVVECLLLPDIAVWIENDSGVSLNNRLLQMLLLLSCTKNRTRMRYTYPGVSTRKSLVKDRIQTVEERTAELNRQLTQVVEQKDQELGELRRELLKAKEKGQQLEEQLAEFKSKTTKRRAVSFLERGSSSTTTVLL